MKNFVSLSLADASHGFDDFDVEGHPTVHRICIGHDLKLGDNFNVYDRAGMKHGGTWLGSVEASVARCLEVDQVTVTRLQADTTASLH